MSRVLHVIMIVAQRNPTPSSLDKIWLTSFSGYSLLIMYQTFAGIYIKFPTIFMLYSIIHSIIRSPKFQLAVISFWRKHQLMTLFRNNWSTNPNWANLKSLWKASWFPLRQISSFGTVSNSKFSLNYCSRWFHLPQIFAIQPNKASCSREKGADRWEFISIFSYAKTIQIHPKAEIKWIS